MHPYITLSTIMNNHLDLTYQNQLIFNRGLKNCHVQGLHGIVFQQNDKYLTRMFVTTPNHVLHQNQCKGNQRQWGPLSLAVHPHRIDIEIHVVTGNIWNIEFQKNQGEETLSTLLPYKWNSHIMRTEKPGGFEAVQSPGIRLKNKRKMVPGDRLKMRSDEMHTVFVEKGMTASWFIYESGPTGDYDGITYSNHDLMKWSAQELYQKPTKQEVLQWLEIAQINLE